MSDSPSRGSGRARIALLLAVAWLLTWAFFKLYKGSPNDLPLEVLELSPWDASMTFRTVVTIELIVGFLALVWPRLGWWILAAQFAIFIGILVKLVAAGAETCGCTGSIIKLKPWQMLTIDAVLLLGILATKPWRAFGKTRAVMLRVGIMIPIVALAAWKPYHVFKSSNDADTIKDLVQGPDPQDPQDPGSPGDAGAMPGGPANLQDPPESQIDGFFELTIAEMEGQMWQDTDAYKLLTPEGSGDLIPFPAHVVMYRKSCEHCRDYLIKICTTEPKDVPVVLIRVPEVDDANQENVITLKPADAVELEMRPFERGYGCPVPVTFEIDDVFMISGVQSHRDE